MNSNNFLLPATILGIIGCNQPIKKPERPNIILIMGDDIGYSDIGCYGSEINTPNLDYLAQNGLRFRTFYNAAKSEPSRSLLLTGLYQGDDRSLNIASVLRQNGYYTMHAGKEHFFKWVPESCYAVNAFDTSFYYWAINQYLIPPDSMFKNPFYLHGKKLSIDKMLTGPNSFYKTDVETNYALAFLEEARKRNKPFFLYLAYNAAHFPLQAMPEDIAKYRGKYKEGWDVIRQRRYERMRAMGLLTEKYKLSPPSSNINKYRGHPKGDEEIRAKIPLYRPWISLTEKEKDELDLEMAVYAAMIDRMDQNIGRIIQWLKKNNLFENTVIMYLSDNGACPYDSNRDFDHPPGGADSYRSLCAAWANMGNTPFKYFKQFGHEGGCHTHFIVHWPAQIAGGTFTDEPGHITDIFPTLLDIADCKYPETTGTLPTIPLHGKSLLPVFKGGIRDTLNEFMSGHTENFRMFRSGDWKIVRSNGEKWELYHLAEDPSEINNLAEKMPEKVVEIEQKYLQFINARGIHQ